MTTLEECYNVIRGGANGADVVRRLGSEASLKKYLGRLLDDQNYETLRQAHDESDAEQAFRCAHSIKGICQNFDLNVLGASSAALTEALRGGVIGPDAEDLFARMSADYQEAAAVIRAYLDSADDAAPGARASGADIGRPR